MSLSSETPPLAWPSTYGAVDYLIQFATTEGSGSPALRRIAHDLLAHHRNFPNEAYGRLVSWPNLNLSTLSARLVRQGLHQVSPAAKPRITVTTSANQAGNLCVVWRPTGLEPLSLSMGVMIDLRDLALDFLELDTLAAAGRRPAHELLYLRDYGSAWPTGTIPERDPAHIDRARELLTCAIKATLDELLAALRLTFQVTQEGEMILDLMQDARGEQRVVGWRIAD